MARRGRRRGRRAYGSFTGYLRSLPRGITKLLLASGIMALGSAVASALSGNLVVNLTIGANSVSLDMGFIPGMAVVFGGLYLFLSGLRDTVRTKI